MPGVRVVCPSPSHKPAHAHIIFIRHKTNALLPPRLLPPVHLYKYILKSFFERGALDSCVEGAPRLGSRLGLARFGLHAGSLGGKSSRIQYHIIAMRMNWWPLLADDAPRGVI